MQNKLWPLILAIFSLSYFAIGFAQKITYPKTKTVNVVDFYERAKVFDPYRWLENIDSADVKQWAAEQNELTRSYLDTISCRKSIKQFISGHCRFQDYFMPLKHGNRYFYFSTDSLQDQLIFRMRDSLNAKPVTVIDPNQFDRNGTIAVTTTAFSQDGSRLAYGLSYGGSDWQEIHVKDIDSLKDWPDTLKWCKFVDIAWDTQNRGFYYNRWPQPGTVKEEDQYNYSRVYWHYLGKPQALDSLIYEVPKDKKSELHLFMSDDGRYLFIYVYRGTDSKLDVYYKDLQINGDFIQLMKKETAFYEYIGNVGQIFYFKTGLKSPTGKVVAIDLNKPSKKNWCDIIPPTDTVIDYVSMVHNQLVVVASYSVQNIIKIYDLDGKFVKELNLPTIGTVTRLSGKNNDSQMFFVFQSFIFPPTVFCYDFPTGELKEFYKPQFDFDFSEYVTRQVYYQSGKVMVPMFLTYRKDLECDGNNPTLLYGYGGFGISQEPQFSASILMWLKCGGIYAVANIRGGGELGWIWHQGGRGCLKQNSFDDFAAAAKWLIDGKLTSPSKLAIMGASNGGLLVAATMEQHPEMFGAVVSQVPVTDMLRFQKFTVGDKWTNEYGDIREDAGYFGCLLAYSPVHNVSIWKKYPTILVTTGENDDRVPPLHAYKLVAALQAKDDGDRPKLLRVESDAGHGQGEPLSKTIEERTDIFAFIFNALGVSDKEISNSGQK